MTDSVFANPETAADYFKTTSEMAKEKITPAAMQTHFNETSAEADARRTANFADIEADMPKRWAFSDVKLIDKASSTLTGAG